MLGKHVIKGSSPFGSSMNGDYQRIEELLSEISNIIYSACLKQFGENSDLGQYLALGVSQDLAREIFNHHVQEIKDGCS